MKNQKKSQKILTAALVLLFLAVGEFLGLALFGQSLLMIIFGFLIAGVLSKTWDRGMKPRKERALLNFQTLMQSRLWWLLLLGMWDGTYRIVTSGYTSPSALGKMFVLLTFALTFIIPLLKLAVKSQKKEKNSLSLNL
ncbi:MAG: hypothetical protein M1138_01265 [Candidatus Thermoplasmatota archaeon]|jgi:hypothetical protein|nr:hypothetical protein [Candidatus Thermoplasmatota archaeon]